MISRSMKALKFGAALVLAPLTSSAFLVVDYTNGGTGSTNAAGASGANDTNIGDSWDFSDSSVLVPEGSGRTNGNVYGGLITTWSVVEDYDPRIRHTGSEFQIQVDPSADADLSAKGMLVWPKSEFLNGGDLAQLAFDETSSVNLNVTSFTGDGELRIVVKQGGSYFVASETFSGSGGKAFSPGSTGQWAPISTTDYSIGAAVPTSFTDIEAVGFYLDMSVTNGNRVVLKFDDFQVDAAELIPDIHLPIVDYLGGLSEVASRAADSNTTAEAEWLFSDTTSLLPGSPNSVNSIIHGGVNMSWSVPVAYTPSILLKDDTSFELELDPGNASDTAIKALLVWDKANFINGGDSQAFAMATDDSISLKVPFTHTQCGDIQFVVKEGGVYYVSSRVFNSGIAGVKQKVSISDDQWATISTDGNYTIGAFADRTFSDVEAVGFYLDLAKTGDGLRFNGKDFVLKATAAAVLRTMQAYQASDGIYVELLTDISTSGDYTLLLRDSEGATIWSGVVPVSAGTDQIVRFQVPGLELNGVYGFSIKDELGNWGYASEVQVGTFGTQVTTYSPAGVTLNFDSLVGRTYMVEWTPDLVQQWQIIDTVVADSEQTEVMVPHQDPEDDTGFYRIGVE